MSDSGAPEQETPPTLEELQAQLREAKRANIAQYEHFAAQGMQLPPTAILSARLEILVQCAFGDLGQKLQFELLFEEKVGSMFAEAKNEAARMKLVGIDGQPLRRS